MRRIPELDSLRGLAAVVVVLFHAFPNTFFLGWSAVDLFFVLSGFLITSIILADGHRPGFARVFYFRRTIRIWPVYFAVLGTVLLANAASRTGFPITGLPQHLVFLQNIQGIWKAEPPPFPAAFAPSWSVAVEEQFYMLWPLLLLTLGGARAVLPLVLVLVSTSVTMRCLGFPINILLTRFDGLAMGGVLALLMLDPEARGAKKRAYTTLFLAVGLIPTLVIAAYMRRFWGSPLLHWKPPMYLCLALFFFSVLGLVIVHSGHRRLAPLRWGPLRAVGLISYSLYLMHDPIFHFGPTILERLGVRSAPLQVAGTWALVALLPVLSYRWLERPFLSLRKYCDYADEKGAHSRSEPIAPQLPTTQTEGLVLRGEAALAKTVGGEA